MKPSHFIILIPLVFSSCQSSSSKTNPQPGSLFVDIHGQIILQIGEPKPYVLTNMLFCWQDDSLIQFSGWDSAGNVTFMARAVKKLDAELGCSPHSTAIPCQFFIYCFDHDLLRGKGRISFGNLGFGLLYGDFEGTIADASQAPPRWCRGTFTGVPNVGIDSFTRLSWEKQLPPQHHQLPFGFLNAARARHR